MRGSSKPDISGPIEPAKHKRTHAEREQMPTGERASHVKAVAAQLLSGVTALALLTFVCVWFGVSLTATAFAYLILIVLLSLIGSFIPVIALCIIAVGCLNYFFTEPIFAFRLHFWQQLVELIVFLITSLVITGLVSRARRLAERALNSQKEIQALKDQLRLAVDTIPAVVWSKLPDGSADFLNQRFRDYTGLSVEDGRGWGWMNAFHPEDRAMDEWRAALAAGEPFEKEARLRRADGNYRWCLLRAVPLREEQGKIVKWYGTTIDIEDRKRAEAVLREQANLLDLTHDTVFVRDMNDVITYWNRGAEELYGWKTEQAVGKVTHQLLHTIFPQPLDEITQRLLSTGRWDGELVHTKRDGTQATVASRWALQLDGSGNHLTILETNNDITERKRVEDALRRQANLLEQTHDAIIVWEFPRTIIFWNRGAERLYGFSREEAIGRARHELLQTVHPLPTPVFEAALEGEGDWTGELTHTTRDGRKILVESRHVVVREADGRRLVLETNRDITERKRAEEALRQAEGTLAHVSRMTSMGELTASIAHEVNQPLTAVVNNANVCLGLLPDAAPNLEEVREALAEIIDDADRASAVIVRVRKLAKRAPIEKSLLDLRDVVNDVLALARYESATRRITIRTDLPNDSVSVSGDRVQLQQVLLNLVVNGMDAMNTVEESKRVLIIGARCETRDGVAGALLSVQDSGTGLKPEEIDRLFEAFYTTKPQGMGIGLAISRSIIEAHGGRLWAEPNKGPGATFLFTLPASA